jgi:hypothetical protein
LKTPKLAKLFLYLTFNKNHENIKLTDSQFEIIKNALLYVYNSQLKYLDQHRTILGEDAFMAVIKQARKYWSLQYDLDKGKHDI